jgi:SAM-dependent methyltransferase
MSKLYDVWWKSSVEEESSMELEHIPHWRCMANLIEEKDLTTKKILDFGCNQGGYLRLLYQHKPYKSAVGVDLAIKSTQEAERKKGSIPATFKAVENLSEFGEEFDVAFSNEVVYLIEDLEDHAKQMWGALKSGGVYYISICSHMNNPLYKTWIEDINKDSPIKCQEHTLEDIVDAFEKQGFAVTARPFRPDGFLEVHSGNDWVPTLADQFELYYRQKIYFRMVKP